MVYYNEIDIKKAAWLRELIEKGLIASGEVDERSIVDVRPDELDGYSQCHFFAGIGIWSYALRLAGWPDDREVWTGSAPCQPFSQAGKGQAFSDKRHLWPELHRLIEAQRPVICFGEQVASRDGLAWFDLVQSDLDRADYACGAVDLCAAGVGAPHRRQRLYWAAELSMQHRDDASMANPGCPTVQSGLRYPKASGSDGSTEGNASQWEWSGRDARIRSNAERMANPALPEAARLGHEREHLSGKRGAASWMVVSNRRQCNGQQVHLCPGGSQQNNLEASGRGPVNGYWSGSHWVLTRPKRMEDGPGLRPIEPGSFPLSDGAPERVGRLRGYGDGIVAQAAEAFIRAYMDYKLESQLESDYGF